jgi:hypothetical protein
MRVYVNVRVCIVILTVLIVLVVPLGACLDAQLEYQILSDNRNRLADTKPLSMSSETAIIDLDCPKPNK